MFHEIRTVVNNAEKHSIVISLFNIFFVGDINTFIAHIFGVFFVRLCIEFLKFNLPVQINNISSVYSSEIVPYFSTQRQISWLACAILIPKFLAIVSSVNDWYCTILKKWLPNYTVSDIKILLNN